MDETGTTVTWPSKLKIGAKSKKDPHVKVCGNVDAVKKAKELILEKLDARSSRVTLKMDVPHTEHSHVIGKGMLTPQNIFDKTKKCSQCDTRLKRFEEREALNFEYLVRALLDV